MTRYSFAQRVFIQIFRIIPILTLLLSSIELVSCDKLYKNVRRITQEEPLLHFRRKRNVADVILTNRNSRMLALQSRYTFQSQLLAKIDTSENGGRCDCLLNRNRHSTISNCHCNVGDLLGILFKKLTSSSLHNDSEIDRLLVRLDGRTKLQIFQLASNNLKRVIRTSAIEKRRKTRKMRRFMRKRHLHRMHSRSAFDRLPILSF